MTTEVTLTDFAIAKGFTRETLSTFGVHESAGRIVTPYYDSAGHEYVRCRLRDSADEGAGFTWNQGTAPLIPYGLHRPVPYAKGLVWLVEGESDCWACWTHDVPALGVPGATNTGCLRADYFDGVQSVAVVQEPGEAGERFPHRVAARLYGDGFAGFVYAVKMPPREDGERFKDPRALMIDDPTQFRKRLTQAYAERIVVPKPQTATTTKPPARHANGTAKVDANRAAPHSASRDDALTTLFAGELTELRASQYLAECEHPHLRYYPGVKSWFIYDGRRWAIDKKLEIELIAKACAVAIATGARKLPDDKEAKAALTFALSLQKYVTLDHVIAYARSDERIVIADRTVFDRDGSLSNFRNGVLDLRTGLLRPHSASDLATRLIDIDYDATATCPLWERFLREIFNGDEKLIEYFQRIVGYTMTAQTREHKFFIFYGGGSNGKGTCIKIMQAVLGDYAQSSPTEAWLRQGRPSRGPDPDLAYTVGARMIAVEEINEERRLDEARVKAFVAGDRMSTRDIYEKPFDFTPTAKLFISTNHRPRIKDDTDGMWRRTILVPFTQKYPEGVADTHLLEKLLTELPGIAAWAVRGCLAWQRDGLAPPDAVRNATTTYRAESDALGLFIEERCVVANGCSALSSTLHTAYEQWAKDNGEKVESQRGLTQKLARRGIGNTHSRAGTLILGLGLASDRPDDGGDDGLLDYARDVLGDGDA
jgi:P4 family phage/plasmid primase-like protien